MKLAVYVILLVLQENCQSGKVSQLTATVSPSTHCHFYFQQQQFLSIISVTILHFIYEQGHV